MLSKIMVFNTIYVTGYTITHVEWIAELCCIVYDIMYSIMYGSDGKGSAIFLLIIYAPEYVKMNKIWCYQWSFISMWLSVVPGASSVIICLHLSSLFQQ